MVTSLGFLGGLIRYSGKGSSDGGGGGGGGGCDGGGDGCDGCDGGGDGCDGCDGAGGTDGVGLGTDDSGAIEPRRRRRRTRFLITNSVLIYSL